MEKGANDGNPVHQGVVPEIKVTRVVERVLIFTKTDTAEVVDKKCTPVRSRERKLEIIEGYRNRGESVDHGAEITIPLERKNFCSITNPVISALGLA